MSYEPYYSGGWQSGAAGGTPITPEALNHMEEGIADALTRSDVVNNLVSSATDVPLSAAQGASLYYQVSKHQLDKENPHGVTAGQIGAAPAIESTDYPGCYYRTVDGYTEWINPPMLTGITYRLTERHNGKPVYSLLINLGTLPNTGTKWVSTGYEAAIRCISITGYDINNGHSLPFYNLGTGTSVSLNFVSVAERGIGIKSDFDASSYNGYAILKFTKKADG